MPVTMTFTIDKGDENKKDPKVYNTVWALPTQTRVTREFGSMQEVASFKPAWDQYTRLSANEREAFKFALTAPSGIPRDIDDIKRLARAVFDAPPPQQPLNVP